MMKTSVEFYVLRENEKKLCVYWMQYLTILNEEENGNVNQNDLRAKEVLEKKLKMVNPDTNLLVLYTLLDTAPYNRYDATYKKIKEYEKIADVSKVKKALNERIKWVY